MDVLRESGIANTLGKSISREIQHRGEMRAEMNARRREPNERERITKKRRESRSFYKSTKKGDYNEDKENEFQD